MSAAAHPESQDGYPFGYAITRSHRRIETSSEINKLMNMHVINPIQERFKRVGNRLFRAKAAMLGLAYNKNINDPRESPAVEIIDELIHLGASARVYDPFVPSILTSAGLFSSTADLGEALVGADCAVFLVDHDQFRDIPTGLFAEVMASPVVVDGENLFCGGEGIVYLGIEKGGNHVQ